MITMPYQALKYQASPAATSGIENTTIQIWDSEITSGLFMAREGEPEESPAAEGEPRAVRAA
jgi:hypothetical protein